MTQLVPCPSCDRHIRLPEANCPFCGGELDAKALGAAYAPRRSLVTSGLKRAALVALGASVAAACGGRTDGTGQDTQPVASTDATSDDAVSSSTDELPGIDPSQVAIYGASIPPSGSDLETTASESASTVPPDTAEPNDTSKPSENTWSPVPPYGAPVFIPDTDATSSAPEVSSTSVVDTVIDGGGAASGSADADAGAPDASASSEPLPEEDASIVAVPTYGAPPLD